MREVEIRLECSLPGDVDRLYKVATRMLYYLGPATYLALHNEDDVELKFVPILGVNVPRVQVIGEASDELAVGDPYAQMEKWCEELSAAWLDMFTDAILSDIFEILNGGVRFSTRLLHRAHSLDGTLQIS